MPKRPPIERFWSKVEKRGPDECWPWLGRLNKRTGYGSFRGEGNTTTAQHFIWEHLHGPLPEGWHVDHLCRNRGCANPKHLEGVPMLVNVMRGVGVGALNAQRTHCIRDHEFTAENTYYAPDSDERHCRQCREDRQRTMRAEMSPERRAEVNAANLARYYRLNTPEKMEAARQRAREWHARKKRERVA